MITCKLFPNMGNKMNNLLFITKLTIELSLAATWPNIANVGIFTTFQNT